MFKKLLGIICTLIGIPVIGFAIYLLVANSLQLIAQFKLDTIAILPLCIGLIKWLLFSAVIAFLGISFIRGGTLLFYFKQFSPDDIAIQYLIKIYKKEALEQVDLLEANSSNYLKIKNIDLADVYQQIDRSKFPDSFNDLMNTIKSRVENR